MVVWVWARSVAVSLRGAGGGRGAMGTGCFPAALLVLEGEDGDE